MLALQLYGLRVVILGLSLGGFPNPFSFGRDWFRDVAVECLHDMVLRHIALVTFLSCNQNPRAIADDTTEEG